MQNIKEETQRKYKHNNTKDNTNHKTKTKHNMKIRMGG